MPTRRIFALTIVTVVAMKPVIGAARLWAIRTLGDTPPGTFKHGAAPVMAVTL